MHVVLEMPRPANYMQYVQVMIVLIRQLCRATLLFYRMPCTFCTLIFFCIQVNPTEVWLKEDRLSERGRQQ